MRIIPRKSLRRRTKALVLVVALAGLTPFMVKTAHAATSMDPIGGGVFQLDGDASTATPASTTGDDWDLICKANPTKCTFASGYTQPSGTFSGTISSFQNDGALNSTIFTGGGSKDPQDISNWQWNDNSGGLPGKDNLLDGFAAEYSNTPASSACPNQTGTGTPPIYTGTCSPLYFGSDRWDNSGDAQQGFWFLQNRVGLSSTTATSGTFVMPGPNNTTVPAQHKVGDLLVVSDFSIGGTTSTINVYEWVGTGGDTNGTLQFLGGSNTANCSTAASGSPFCGIVNSGTGLVTSPWNFLDKAGNTNFAQGEFYEGGINLTAFPSIGSECFASFTDETRSSTSTTATLKDFILGNFGNCGSTTVTTPEDGSGNAISTIQIGTNGTVSVKDHAVVTPSGPSSAVPTGTVKFWLCGPQSTDALAQCTTGGTAITPDGTLTTSGSTGVTDSATATVTQVGHYCWRAVYQGDSNYPSSSDSSLTECFTVTPRQPTLTTQATVSTASGFVNVSGPVISGSTIGDTATLSNTANQPGSPIINPTTAGASAGGSITWNLYGPATLANSCGALVFGPVSRTVSGDNTYPTATQTTVSTTVTTPGTYTWVASYAADTSGNTLGVSATACPETGTSKPETVVVQKIQTSIATNPFVYPQDTATLYSGPNNTNNGTLTGSVSFSLYDNSIDCAAAGSTGLEYGPEAQSLTAVTSPATKHTNNSSFAIDSTNLGTYYWLVQYSSSDVTHSGVQSVCVENTDVSDIHNDAGPGTAYP